MRPSRARTAVTFVSTITIPVLGQPHLLRAALYGLVHNSFYRHRIIVLHSNPLAYPSDPAHAGSARDWEVDVNGASHERFTSVESFLESHAGWLDSHGIESVDVTSEALAFRAGHVGAWEGGVDIAFKNNFGLRMTATEWTVPNWDADFYPGMHWDEPLVDFAMRAAPKSMLVPTHMQPRLFDEIPSWSDPWMQAREGAQNRLAIPTLATVRDRGAAYVTREAFLAFCGLMRRPGAMIHERPGVREKLHWVPAMLRTREVREAGGYGYQGAGYDVEFDDRLGARGFDKVGFLDSFILHKGYVPIENA